MQRLAPVLEANQVAWSRAAKRWGELTSPASRTDPELVGAAREVRAAIAAAATNPTGWATPDQLTSRLDLPKTVKTLHLGIVAALDIACVVRDTAADHPGLTAPARIIGMSYLRPRRGVRLACSVSSVVQRAGPVALTRFPFASQRAQRRPSDHPHACLLANAFSSNRSQRLTTSRESARRLRRAAAGWS
jgi:hypothetical protein